MLFARSGCCRNEQITSAGLNRRCLLRCPLHEITSAIQIENDNLNIVYGDFLKVNLKDYFNKNDKLNVIANIPYYITTPIITKFIKEDFIPINMVLMVQKEVAERLSSKPKNKEYGAISVILNYFFEIEYLYTVNRSSFEPVPNVDSAIIKLSKRDNILELKDFDVFEKLVYDSFKQKRKTLKNNLKNYDLEKINNILSKFDMSLSNRAEDISYEVFVDISNNL